LKNILCKSLLSLVKKSSCKRILTWITLHTESKYKTYQSNLTLELYKMILNYQWKDQKCSNRNWKAQRYSNIQRGWACRVQKNDKDDDDAPNQMKKTKPNNPRSFYKINPKVWKAINQNKEKKIKAREWAMMILSLNSL